MKCLFEVARVCSPSVVFIDEIDALVSTRGGSTSSSNSEHEASRRMKTQFLTEMDGLMSNVLQTDNNHQTDYNNTITDIDTTLITTTNTTTTTTTNNNNNNIKAKSNVTITNNINDRVIVLATTNCPWDLDPGILRRLEKRIYVPLPDISAREDQFMKVG